VWGVGVTGLIDKAAVSPTLLRPVLLRRLGLDSPLRRLRLSLRLPLRLNTALRLRSGAPVRDVSPVEISAASLLAPALIPVVLRKSRHIGQ
jgi:hypothetical protein